MMNVTLFGLAFLVFGFSLIYLALTNNKISIGVRICIGIIGVWLIPGAVQMLGFLLHSVFFSPFVWVPVAILAGYFVWTTLDRRKPF